MVSPSEPCQFDLDGAQTVRTIQTTYDRLSVAMTLHSAVVVHCDGVSECDASLFQLLLAAKRSADKAGKSFTLAAPVKGRLRTTLEQSGFLAGTESAFWLGEAVA